jgi:hypothetical protein
MGGWSERGHAGVRGAALVGLAGAALALLVTAIAGGAHANLVWALAVPVVPAALVVLTARDGRPGPAGVALVLLVATQALALAVVFEHGAGREIAGVPRGTAIMLLGLGLAPLVVVPLLYALTFPAKPDRDGTRGR